MIDIFNFFKKKIRFSLVFGTLFLAIFTACSSDTLTEHELGSNLIENSTEVSLIDTFTINSSTVKLDSVITSSSSKAFVGRYEDEYLGIVTSDFYGLVDGGFKLDLISVGNSPKNAVLDSIVFVTYYNQEYYGDTTKLQKISVHEVIEEMEYKDDKIPFFYGHDSFAYDAQALGDTVYYAKPKAVVSRYMTNAGAAIPFTLRLSDDFGKDILTKAKQQNDSINQPDKWLKYFKGIIIKGGDINTAILSFQMGKEKMYIRMYYRYTEGEDKEQKFHDFPVSQSLKAFNNYQSDRTSTLLNSPVVETLEGELFSEDTEDMAFIQGGIGFMTKIQIPYLENLRTLGISGGVLKAELLIYPENDSFDDFIVLPRTGVINVYKTNDHNKNLGGLKLTDNKPLTALLVMNDNEDEIHYSIDLTNYVTEVLVNGQDEDDALLFALPITNYGQFFERLIINNDKESDYRIRLKASYVIQR